LPAINITGVAALTLRDTPATTTHPILPFPPCSFLMHRPGPHLTLSLLQGPILLLDVLVYFQLLTTVLGSPVLAFLFASPTVGQQGSHAAVPAAPRVWVWLSDPCPRGPGASRDCQHPGAATGVTGRAPKSSGGLGQPAAGEQAGCHVICKVVVSDAKTVLQHHWYRTPRGTIQLQFMDAAQQAPVPAGGSKEAG
jgi:hypothetical protein